MEKKFKIEKAIINKYFCVKKRKLNNKNLPTNPINGGIPAIDKKTNATVIDVKHCLLKIFKSLIVLIFFVSYKNNKQKIIYIKHIYIYMFMYIIDNP